MVRTQPDGGAIGDADGTRECRRGTLVAHRAQGDAVAVVEVRGLRKEYRVGRGRRTVALDGVDFEVPGGTVFGFLGPNGAGKTTTIRCLLNLARPTSGRCMVLGVDPQVHFERVQRQVGSVIEAQALFPAFSGHRNLAHLARLYRLPVGRVDEVLARVGLAARADDPVRAYSLGMRQRLGVAAALLKDPELLILDEPANGLDPEGIVEMRNLLQRLGAEGRTVFVSSHQLAEAQQMCDHIAVLARGRCVASGPVDGVLAAVGTSGVVARVDDPRAAIDALAREGIDAWIDDDGLVRSALPAGDAPQLARALARHDIFPLELRPGGTSLEDAFLALTRDRSQP
jgi:ABC-2 type transport system ATP-binding protein